jgi:prophage maintenance system killer protein
VVAFNRATRGDDEWFDEPDDLERVRGALRRLEGLTDAVEAAAAAAFAIAGSQAFGEGNKRTSLLAARWILDRNGEDGTRIIPPDDRALAGLLEQAAFGKEVGDQILQLLSGRRRS